MQHDKCLNHIQLNQQINTGSEHIPGSGRAEHSSCLLHSCTFQIHPAERSAWSQVPVSRGYFPASQTGQSSRKVVRPSPLPFLNQMALILKENNYDVWSWVKIIATWFGKKTSPIYHLNMEITKKFTERGLQRTMEFSGYMINLCLLPQSQVCCCRRTTEGNKYTWTQTLWMCCWRGYTNPLPRSSCCPTLPW